MVPAVTRAGARTGERHGVAPRRLGPAANSSEFCTPRARRLDARIEERRADPGAGTPGIERRRAGLITPPSARAQEVGGASASTRHVVKSETRRLWQPARCSRIVSFSAASRPLRSAGLSGSAYPRAMASSSAASNDPPAAISDEEVRGAVDDAGDASGAPINGRRASAPRNGTPASTAASKASATPRRRAGRAARSPARRPASCSRSPRECRRRARG